MNKLIVDVQYLQDFLNEQIRLFHIYKDYQTEAELDIHLLAKRAIPKWKVAIAQEIVRQKYWHRTYEIPHREEQAKLKAGLIQETLR